MSQYCPNCSSALSETAEECEYCGAMFGEGSSWEKVKNANDVPSSPTGVNVLGKFLLVLAYPGLTIGWLAALGGMQKFGMAFFIGIMASIVFLPVILLGHVLATWGQRKK